MNHNFQRISNVPFINPDIPVGRFNLNPQSWYIENEINSGDEVSYEYVSDEGRYFVDTSHQKGMLVLPHRPKPGFKVTVVDHHGSWIFYPLVIHRNGNDIMGLSENLVCDEPNMMFSLVFAPETKLGWIVQMFDPTKETKGK